MITYRRYGKEHHQVPLSKDFFQGWPNPPSERTHREILSRSHWSFVAIDTAVNEIVGFINVISDGVHAAYMPLLEVVETHRKQGIGRRLVQLALEATQHLHMVDLCCDEELVSFYERLGLMRGTAMLKRNYAAQRGITLPERAEKAGSVTCQARVGFIENARALWYTDRV